MLLICQRFRLTPPWPSTPQSLGNISQVWYNGEKLEPQNCRNLSQCSNAREWAHQHIWLTFLWFSLSWPELQTAHQRRNSVKLLQCLRPSRFKAMPIRDPPAVPSGILSEILHILQIYRELLVVQARVGGFQVLRRVLGVLFRQAFAARSKMRHNRRASWSVWEGKTDKAVSIWGQRWEELRGS